MGVTRCQRCLCCLPQLLPNYALRNPFVVCRASDNNYRNVGEVDVVVVDSVCLPACQFCPRGGALKCFNFGVTHTPRVAAQRETDCAAAAAATAVKCGPRLQLLLDYCCVASFCGKLPRQLPPSLHTPLCFHTTQLGAG